MYLCPLCGMQYPGDVPANCQRCKRPLVLRGRFRIESSIQETPVGEDFDVVDLKTNDSVILRELRIKKSEAAQRQADMERYRQNRERLGKMKFEGKPVIIDAFEEESKNSRLYYLVFDMNAWEMLGPELDGPDGGSDDPMSTEGLPELSDRGMDPELEAMLAKINAERGGPPKVTAPPLGDDGDDSGAMVPAGKDSPPAKRPEGGGAMAPTTKIVIGVSLVAIIGAIIAAVMMVL